MQKKMKPVWSAGLLALAAGAVTLTLSMAVGETRTHRPDPENGLVLVRSLCINCHVVPGTAQRVVPAGVPTFHEIANRPGQTMDNIIHILVQPHNPMPDTHLTRKEMKDIIAYLDRLRAEKGKPPLLPEPPKKKHKIDRPSPT